ncbi:hypothetical protein ACIBJD_34515 [Kitasatospora sp. NPDC050467]|uniref:hypothetical protein n=1 Tax=Kitasatospora sp. NPDC050467 TaxID=3364053 RepID=UPI0037992E7D
MAKPVPKHLTVTIDFDVQTDGSTVQYQRARAAYEAAVEAAIREARKVLPPDSIRAITSDIDWSYRWQRHHDVRFTHPETATAGDLSATETADSTDGDEQHWTENLDVSWDDQNEQWIPHHTVERGDVAMGPLDDDEAT